MKVAVVGAGYVGGVSAAGFAAAGHDVALHDLRHERAVALATGAPPFHEPGLDVLVQRSEGRLQPVADLSRALRGAEVALICVDTPAAPTGTIDLSRVEAAVRAIGSAASGPLVVAIRSTVVPGTTERIDREFLADPRARGIAMRLAANPEFLREGRAVQDFTDPDRVVIGATHAGSRETLARLYGFVADRLMFMSPSSAEMAKYANNSLLALLVSFSNELATFAEQVADADVLDALLAVHADRRWHEAEGRWTPSILSYLWPGSGYGGSCLPKDVKALLAAATERGVPLGLLAATDATNERQPSRLVERIGETLPLVGARVAVLGTAFKAGTNDLRGSPGMAVAEELRRRGADVITFDPLIHDSTEPTLDEVLEATQAWVVMTGANEFEDLAERARQSGVLLVDARRRYSSARAGYIGPGIGTS